MAFSIAATMIVKNEEDILPFVLANTLNQVDKIFIINNNSIDTTEDVILSFRDRVEYYENKKEYYNHGEWMTQLANMAIKNKFDWIVPIDGDEIWSNLSVLRNNNQYNFFVIESIKNHMFTNYTGSFHPSKMPYYKEEKTLRNAFKTSISIQAITEGSHYIKGVNNRIVSYSSSIAIDHYPFRSENQYIRKVTNGTAAMMTRKTTSVEAWHWKVLTQNLDKFKKLTAFRKFVKLF